MLGLSSCFIPSFILKLRLVSPFSLTLPYIFINTLWITLEFLPKISNFSFGTVSKATFHNLNATEDMHISLLFWHFCLSFLIDWNYISFSHSDGIFSCSRSVRNIISGHLNICFPPLFIISYTISSNTGALTILSLSNTTVLFVKSATR